MSKPEYHIAELRVGNYLLFNGHTSVEITIIDRPELKIDYLEAEDDDMYDAIYLDWEWMERLGFKWDFSTFDYVDGVRKGNFFISGVQNEWHFEFSNGNKVQRVVLKYVHQLQNLYFSLTGEELTASQIKRANG